MAFGPVNTSGTIGPELEEIKKTAEEAAGSKLQSETITLSASSWTGTTIPYQYDLGTAYSGKSIILGFDSENGTEEQLAEIRSAILQGGSGTKIYAFGNKPTSDIPMIILYS